MAVHQFEVIARVHKLPKDLTITLSVIETPEFRVRMWLGRWLIRLGVWTLGCRFEFMDQSHDGRQTS